MAKARCGLGFDCASIMQAVGINPKDCDNYKTCGAALDYAPDEAIELVQIRDAQRQNFRISRHQAAQMLLRHRGNSQSLDDFEVMALLEAMEQELAALRTTLERDFLENPYIAPEGCTIHRYNVKRKYETVVREGGKLVKRTKIQVYWYNKLMGRTAYFAPAEERVPVRVLHLSHDSDPRNLEARRGIERRNRLEHLRTRLRNLTQSLHEAITELQLPMQIESPLDAPKTAEAVEVHTVVLEEEGL
jgi:hypothetical protein